MIKNCFNCAHFIWLQTDKGIETRCGFFDEHETKDFPHAIEMKCHSTDILMAGLYDKDIRQLLTQNSIDGLEKAIALLCERYGNESH